MADDLNSLLQANRSSSVLQGIANPAQINPLAAMNSATTAATNMTNLQKLQSEASLGEAYQGAIDPATGRLNPLLLNQLIAKDPRNAFSARVGAESSQALQGSQHNLNVAQNNAVNDAVTAALASDDANLLPTVVQQAQRLIDAGVVPRDRMMLSLSNLSNDPAVARRQLETILTQQQPIGGDKQTTVYGTPGNLNQGGAVTGTSQNRRTGAITPAGQPLPLGLTPEQEAEIVSVPDNNKTLPDGSPNPNYGKSISVTRGDLLRAAGVNPANPSAGSGLGTGRPPDSLRNPSRTPTAAPGATPPAPATPQPRPIATTQSPADAELIKQSGPKFQADIDAGNAAQGQHAILGNMLADTAQFTTGPLAGIIGKFRNMAGNLGLKVEVDAQSAKESFNKLAAGLANAQGAGSDSRMNINIAANPHEELSPAGVDLVLRQLQGNADYVQAKAKLAQAYPNRSDYGGFQKAAADLDPRVFQMTRLTDEQRQTYWKSLDSTAQKQLGAAIKKAKELGVLGG